MSDKQITYVTKGGDTHESITRLGSDSFNETKSEIIEQIEGKKNSFYTKDAAGVRSDVLVVDGKNGKYLRAHKDGSPNNNLLSLPDFPKK